jgi:hypothetical protein
MLLTYSDNRARPTVADFSDWPTRVRPASDARAARPVAGRRLLALLAVGNAVMLAVFVRHARRLALPPATAVTLWMLALRGTFCTTLLLLYRIGVMP